MSGHKSVLVADSDGVHATLFCRAVAEQGWTAIQARDAVAATAAVLRHRPSAVILSQKLPAGGAVLTLRRIRASVHTAMTPVVAVTENLNGAADEMMRHGADHCVAMPPDVKSVAEWIRKRLAEPAQVMEAPSSIIRDPERLKSLSRTGLLDTPPSDSFDILTRLAAAILGAPVALVSLVDDKRQFFKSHVGLPEPWASRRETPLTHSFCQWVVSDHDALIVDDARTHPVLRNNRALHELGVVAYAGIPLTPTTGDPIGSFCAVDTKPREWSSEDLMVLRDLTAAAEACIAVEEFNTWERAAHHGKAPGDINRFPILRAIGAGIPPLAKLVRRDDRRLGEAERQSLLTLMERLGEQAAKVAGAA